MSLISFMCAGISCHCVHSYNFNLKMVAFAHLLFVFFLFLEWFFGLPGGVLLLVSWADGRALLVTIVETTALPNVLLPYKDDIRSYLHYRSTLDSFVFLLSWEGLWQFLGQFIFWSPTFWRLLCAEAHFFVRRLLLGAFFLVCWQIYNKNLAKCTKKLFFFKKLSFFW